MDSKKKSSQAHQGPATACHRVAKQCIHFAPCLLKAPAKVSWKRLALLADSKLRSWALKSCWLVGWLGNGWLVGKWLGNGWLVTWLVGKWLVGDCFFSHWFMFLPLLNNLRNHFMRLMKRIPINIRSLVGLNMDL